MLRLLYRERNLNMVTEDEDSSSISPSLLIKIIELVIAESIGHGILGWEALWQWFDDKMWAISFKH